MMATTWHCPVCKTKVTVYLSLSGPPHHYCKKALGKYLPLIPKVPPTKPAI